MPRCASYATPPWMPPRALPLRFLLYSLLAWKYNPAYLTHAQQMEAKYEDERRRCLTEIENIRRVRLLGGAAFSILSQAKPVAWVRTYLHLCSIMLPLCTTQPPCNDSWSYRSLNFYPHQPRCTDSTDTSMR